MGRNPLFWDRCEPECPMVQPLKFLATLHASNVIWMSWDSKFSTPQSTHIRRFVDLNSFCEAVNMKTYSPPSHVILILVNRVSLGHFSTLPTLSHYLCFRGIFLFPPSSPAKEQAGGTKVQRGRFASTSKGSLNLLALLGCGGNGQASMHKGAGKQAPKETGFPSHPHGDWATLSTPTGCPVHTSPVQPPCASCNHCCLLLTSQPGTPLPSVPKSMFLRTSMIQLHPQQPL